MAWTDTTNCSFCGREIPIFRKFGNGQFCSKAHEEGFLQQQNQLAVEVLHRTHDALKAYKPTASSIEDILGFPVAKPPVPEPIPESLPAPVALEEAFTEPEPVEAQIPEPAQAWPEAPVPLANLREFDQAAAKVLPPLAAPMDSTAFHFGDSLGRLHERGFLASLRRLWESLTMRRA